MLISNHRLHLTPGQPVPFRRSPNARGALSPEYLVIHYTAGRNAEESIRWMCNPTAQASAHLVIGRDGAVTQLVPFNQVAWHAGVSSWEGRRGLNRFSIGIELDNAGRLTRRTGGWYHWTGTPRIPDDEVVEAIHKNESTPAAWHDYTPEQLDAALEVSALLVRKYGLRDVLGHDDISPGRKSDPGPAFPMESFRARLFGRQDDEPARYRVATVLNVRTGPGAGFPTLPQSPLPQGTHVEVLAREGSWRRVDVIDAGPLGDVQGWVHGRYLERLDAPAALVVDPLPD